MTRISASRPLGCVALGAVLLAFLALGFAGILRHEMWRDELEIWLIARDSGSLGELLANMGIQGHPALWYLINFGLSRFTDDPFAMQVLHLLIGAGAAALFLAFAPFGRGQRILFCFGYFTLYEFTIISRSYGLELLLLFLFCALFEKRRTLHPVMAVILLLMANTNIYGTIIATGLGSTLILDFLVDRKRVGYAVDRTLALSLAIFGTGVVTALVHMVRQARRVGGSHNYVPTWDLQWFGDSLSAVLYGYLPVPDWTNPSFWNTNIVQALPGALGTWVGIALSLLLLLVSAGALWRAPRALALFVLGTAPMLVMFFFVWYGQLRHHAQIWVLFLACCWLSHSLAGAAGRGMPGPRLRSGFLTLIFVIHAGAGAWAYAVDWARPFSNSKEVGEYLGAGDLRKAIWVGSEDFAVQPIMAYADGQIYYVESDRFGTFVYWGRERRPRAAHRILETSISLMRTHQQAVVLILNVPIGLLVDLPYTFPPGVRLRPLARFDGAIVWDENYYLYLLDEPGPG